MYLYHPTVLYVLGLSLASPPRYSPFFLAEHYTAVLMLTAGVASVAYVLVEAPFAALERWAVAAGGEAVAALLAGRERAEPASE